MEITDQQKKILTDEAIKALVNVYPSNAQPPYIYATAVLSKSGNIYSSANYGSDTASLTLHAEQAALSHAASHGDANEVVAVSVASREDLPEREFTPPCHMCKQLIWENSLRSGIEILVIMVNGHRETKEFKISEVMAYPWPAKKS